MKKYETTIKDLYIIEPTLRDDVTTTYDRGTFKKIGLCMNFVQDNESFSKKNVLRGIHIQIKKPQGKLVSVLEGKIFDVAVDLRKESRI